MKTWYSMTSLHSRAPCSSYHHAVVSWPMAKSIQSIGGKVIIDDHDRFKSDSRALFPVPHSPSSWLSLIFSNCVSSLHPRPRGLVLEVSKHKFLNTEKAWQRSQPGIRKLAQLFHPRQAKKGRLRLTDMGNKQNSPGISAL